MQGGLVHSADLHKALTRILLQRFRVGSFDPPTALRPYTTIEAGELASAAHEAVALAAAKEAVCLLYNANGTLPLVLPPGDEAPAGTAAPLIAVLGPMADNADVQQGGKSDYVHFLDRVRTIFAGIQSAVVAQGHPPSSVVTAPGVTVTGTDTDRVAAALALAAVADVVMVTVGIDGTVEHEGSDRTTIGLPGRQLEFLQNVTAVVERRQREVGR